MRPFAGSERELNCLREPDSFLKALAALNPDQREAVTFEGPGPLLVLAGPGSGKTLVITRRVQYLLAEKGISPERILVLTFTRDAAASMQHRFQILCDHSDSVNFGTFHSIFYQILKASTPLNERQMLTDADKRRILLPILSKMFQQLSPYRRTNLCTDLIQAIGYYKNTGISSRASQFLPPEVQTSFERIYRAYEERRMEEGRLDFDDMLGDCRNMLQQNNSMRSYWQERFAHILIDEFQDINPAQYEVIKLLSKAPYNLFAVGDDDQSIYGFRGSDPGCMQSFAREYQARQVILGVNYRSGPEIVKNAQSVIGENQNRFRKNQISYLLLNASAGSGSTQNADGGSDLSKGGVRTLKFRDRREEYDFLSTLCSETCDTAFLFRTNKLMQLFALSLKRKGIPFEMRERLQNPYENEIVQDLMAYLRLSHGEQNTSLLYRIINKPSRYVSREAMAESGDLKGLLKYYRNRDGRVFERLEILEKQLASLGRLALFPGLHYVRKIMGYEEWLLDNCGEDESKREDALMRLNWLSEEAAEHPELEEWLRFQKDSSRTANEPKRDSHIHLMTVHASKGLEFERVIMPDCNDRIYPYGNLLSEQAVEEERRIFYVGMTRAKDSLLLTYVAGTAELPEKPSRFLGKLKSLDTKTLPPP